MKTSSLTLFRLPNFRLLFISRVLTSMALQSQAVIVGWQVYSLSHSPLLLGLIGLTEAVPAIANAFFAGHIVDSNKPHIVLRFSLAALALNTFFLLLVGGHFIDLSNHALLICIFSGVFASGLARAYLPPSLFSILPHVIERKDLPSATAWINSGFQIANICGPALAGLLYGLLGERSAWTLPASLLALSFLSASLLTIDLSHLEKKLREPFLKSVTQGWKFILRNRILLSVMSLDMFAVLFGGASAMLPAVADQVLHVGSEGLGALRAAPATGAILVAIYFALRPMNTLSGTRLLWVVAGFGFCMIGFGYSTSFYLSLFFLALSGLFDGIGAIIRVTIMQLLTPDHLRGRVSSVNSMFITSSNEIGAFESGVAARALGLVPSIVVGGFATLLVVATTALLTPELRKARITSDHKTEGR
jgi:MFS family permease